VQVHPQSGYHTYVYLFDITTRSLDRLTKDNADESFASWSPDGARIAYASTRNDDPDHEPSTQLFIADAKNASAEVALTPIARRGGLGKPEFSADGKWIAFLESDDNIYGTNGMEHLAIVAADGATPPQRVAASEALDRGVSQPRWGDDGKNIFAIVADDMYAYGARIPVGPGNAVPITDKPIVLGPRHSAGSCAVVVSGDDGHPNEIYSARVVGGKLKFQPLTHQNDALFAALRLGTTEEVRATSRDGTEVHGLLTTPPKYVAGTKVPMLLRIHGGPASQDQHAFAFERQWFAARGYAVLAVNYRGSAGRGAKFSKAIFASCGHYEVEDLQAMVDQVVKMGVADPNKLGVGGWGYGGILTNYAIARDSRFKAATSGAGAAVCGKDQYIIQDDYAIGARWDPKEWKRHQKTSYPFLHADRIKTPTLFLGGELDFTVPAQGGQLMYHALRSRNIDTQLVIYPHEFHEVTRPSVVRDRYQRYLAWYESHINGKARVALHAARQK
jgi:dipeptidyl aminopeptidase/acylaminoacyl peptidase